MEKRCWTRQYLAIIFALSCFCTLLIASRLFAGTYPTISITYPTPPVALEVGQNHIFSIEATAGSGIKGIEWYIGSSSKKYTSYTGTWDYYQQESWTTLFPTAGTYYVHAYVYDRENPQREAFVTWEVHVATPTPPDPPDIMPMSPSTPLTLGVGQSQTFNIEAEAASGIKGIEWYIGSSSKKYTSLSMSWVYYRQDSWTTSFDTEGTCYVHAYVYDRETGQREDFCTWEIFVGQPEIPGDINNDGTVDISDVISGLRIITNGVLDGGSEPVGDTDGNNQIGMADILHVLRSKVQIEYSFFDDFNTTTDWNNFLPYYDKWFDASQHGKPSTEWNDPGPSDTSGYAVQVDGEDGFLHIKTSAGSHDRPKLMTKQTFNEGIFEWRVFVPDNMLEGAGGANTAVAAWLFDPVTQREIDFEIGWGPQYQRTEQGLTAGDNKLLIHMAVQPTGLQSSNWLQPDGQYRYRYKVIEAGVWYTLKIVLRSSDNKYLIEWYFKKAGQDYPALPAHSFTTPYGPSDTAFSIACSVENFSSTPSWLGDNSPPLQNHSAQFDFVRHQSQ